MKRTALSKYQRLEAAGIWRPDRGAQRLDVIVSVGESTLIISDTRERVLAHWSLTAVARENPGVRPAIYHPNGDPDETLEIPADETTMIDAIETLRSAIERQRPHPGRLRMVGFLSSLALFAAIAVFWLPPTARHHALSVVPEVKRTEIAGRILKHLEKMTGPVCEGSGGAAALAALAERLPFGAAHPRLLVVRTGVSDVLLLPGGIGMINASLVEDFEEPDVVAGFIIAAYLRAQAKDPLDHLLERGGLSASLRLLTTGNLSDEVLKRHAEDVLKDPTESPDAETLLAGFRRWKVRSTPYAYARDKTGESTLELIEADPFSGTSEQPAPVLNDSDWLRLQAICGG